MEKVRVLQLSLVAIVTVIIVEGLVGFVVNSLAILSDAAHALFDTVTMVILLLTTRMALKPPDEEHHYGHAKIESIGGLIGGLALIILAAVLFFEAVLRLLPDATHVQPEMVGFVAVFYTLCVDVFRITITRRGVQSEESRGSITVKASFFHAFADFMSTVIALVGFGLAVVAHYLDADAFASLILSLFLVYLSVGLLRTSFGELSDQVPRDLADRIKAEVMRVRGVGSCTELKVRRAGGVYYIDLTIAASGGLSLKEAHDLTRKIEHNIAATLGEVSVTIHVEPEKEG